MLAIARGFIVAALCAGTATAQQEKPLLDWAETLRFQLNDDVNIIDVGASREMIAPLVAPLNYGPVETLLPYGGLQVSQMFEIVLGEQAVEASRRTVGFGFEDIDLIATTRGPDDTVGYYLIPNKTDAIIDTFLRRALESYRVNDEDRWIDDIPSAGDDRSPFAGYEGIPSYYAIDNDILRVAKNDARLDTTVDAPLLLDNVSYRQILEGVYDPIFKAVPVQVLFRPNRPERTQRHVSFLMNPAAELSWNAAVDEIGELPDFDSYAFVQWRDGLVARSGIVIAFVTGADVAAERFRQLSMVTSGPIMDGRASLASLFEAGLSIDTVDVTGGQLLAITTSRPVENAALQSSMDISDRDFSNWLMLDGQRVIDLYIGAAP
jgi:hypothetical protein